MSLLHYSSWTGRDSASDDAIVDSGEPTYITNAPSNSLGSRSVNYGGDDRHIVFWNQGAVISEPGTRVVLHARFRLTSNNANNANSKIGCGRSGIEMITMSLQASTGRPTIRVSGTVVATAAAPDAYTTLKWERPIIDIGGFLEGDRIDVYNGDLSVAPVVSHTITAPQAAILAGVGAPNAWHIGNDGDGSFDVTDLAVMDPNDGLGFTDYEIFDSSRTFTVIGDPFSGDGTPQDWTGGYQEIDDLPFDGLDVINTEAVDTEARFTRPAVTGRTNDVYGIKWQSGARLNGTSAGETIDLKADDGSATVVNVPMPANGIVNAYYHVKPSGGQLDPPSADATLFSYISRT